MKLDVGLWFSGASDHLYELQFEKAPKKLQSRLKKFQDKVLTWGHGFKNPPPTNEDAMWAMQEAKDLLRAIDTSYGVPTSKGEWE